MRRNSRKVAIVPPRARRAVEPALGRRRGGCAARTARNPQEDVAIAQGRSVRRAPAPLRACAVVGERVGQRRAQMRVDGTRHTETAALLQRIGDLAGAGTLIPAHGTPARYEVIEWLTFVSSELHKTYSPWLFHADTADSTRRQCLEARSPPAGSRRASRDARLSDGRLHGGGRVSVRGRELVELPAHPARAVSASRRVHGAGGRAGEGRRSARGRRPRPLTRAERRAGARVTRAPRGCRASSRSRAAPRANRASPTDSETRCAPARAAPRSDSRRRARAACRARTA